MNKVYGFSEEGFRRIKEQYQRLQRTPTVGAQRRRQVPVLGATTTTGGDGGPDGMGCCGQLIQGIPLSGSPTICCEGHEQLRVDMGPTIGVKNLWHAGGDVWSTFSDDAEDDNPYERTCCLDDPPPEPPAECETEGTDQWDVVLDVAAKTITLEARDTLVCGDPICATWQLVGDLFQCFGSNAFRIQHFSGMGDVEIRQCVCVKPIVAFASAVLCFGDPDPSPYPQYFHVKISGMTGPGTGGGSCTNPCDAASCEALNGVYLASRVGGGFSTPCTGAVNVCHWGAPITLPPELEWQCGSDFPMSNLYVWFNLSTKQFEIVIANFAGGYLLCMQTDPIEVSDPLKPEDFLKVFTFEHGRNSCRCLQDDLAVVMVPPGIPDPPGNSGHCSNPCA